MKTKPISNSVHDSRAGDRFHYLWAARRCLRMIHPKSPVICVTVECSLEPDAPGETVIDLTELITNSEGKEETHYYQLKHTTKRLNKPMPFSELSRTLKGFALRFSKKRSGKTAATAKFWIVTNRPIAKETIEGARVLGRGAKAPNAITKKLEQATGLSGRNLSAFCKALNFSDQEGDYLLQEQELRAELGRYSAGTVDRSAVLEISSLVADQAVPPKKGYPSNRHGIINREQVLKVLGVTSPDSLFPAPAAMELLPEEIVREQYPALTKAIRECGGHLIIHAEGGVGKSVVARHLEREFAPHAVLYDCFGGGSYLQPSRPRHRPCDALLQVSNELAIGGLCQITLPKSNADTSELLRRFLDRLKEACEIARLKDPNSLLVVLFDAADNAEMAAEQFSDACFARLLIREGLPAGCRVVWLCRTERIYMLNPPSSVIQLPLFGFSLAETASHLKSRFHDAAADAVEEFQRLTGGNPRVQANCLNFSKSSKFTIREMLNSLGPGRVTTLDEQIGTQIAAAIAHLTDQNTQRYREEISEICRGLATLPPFIPIAVLAAAAGVAEHIVKSFVTDLGRPLWSPDGASVQFRDEPTEFWFKQTYAGNVSTVKQFTNRLEPLASSFSYVARSLPALWLQAGEQARLIEIALSDRLLPENNPTDAREILIYRLQYALRAAVQTNNLMAAAKLAMRAGEEMAGDKRQAALFQSNPDLVASLQEPQIVMEWAYKRRLSGGWRGSECIYTAALLASNSASHGEARSYVQSSWNWLGIHFNE